MSSHRHHDHKKKEGLFGYVIKSINDANSGERRRDGKTRRGRKETAMELLGFRGVEIVGIFAGKDEFLRKDKRSQEGTGALPIERGTKSLAYDSYLCNSPAIHRVIFTRPANLPPLKSRASGPVSKNANRLAFSSTFSKNRFDYPK
ncbi:hypothetical protein PIB30_042546 [Stylosanthes scabra]|uniref:Uncharacterized protein n=1 Tax=Stylosanthes scabra TaxID=79078 RepID=A0ABU6WEX9_9FABA|nr:hypothetical protein [Stylosanthes scabra]